MSEIQLFTFNDHQVRTLLIDGEPWFLTVDVCAICALRDASSALRRVDDRDVRRLRRSDTPQLFRGIAAQVQEITVVNESGLYDLVFQSPKPEAREFKRWVTSDLLPRYRRGELVNVEAAPAAVIPDMSTTEGALVVLDMLRDQIQGRAIAEQRVAELEPAAESWDALANAKGDMSLRDAAQILSRDPDVEVGQNRLAKLLRELGWIDKKTKRPYQTQIDAGRLSAIVSHWTDEDGELHTKYLARITAKGLEALRGHLNGTKPLAIRFPADDVWGEAS